MKADLKGIITNVFYLYTVQGLNLILPVLVLPYLIKTLSVESFGVYSFVFAFSQFLILFVDFGFNISATKKIAENYDNEVLVKETYWNITLIKLFLTIVSLFFVGIIMLFIPKIAMYSEGIFYSYIMVLGTAIFPIWWFQGNNKMKQMSIISAISKLITYPLIFIFVKGVNDYNVAIIIQSLSYLVAGIISVFYLFRYYQYYFKKVKISRDIKLYFEEIRDSFPIFLSNSTVSLYTNSVTIFLGIFSTEYNVGLFGAMERIVRMICLSVSPINQVCFPIIARFKRESFSKARKMFSNVLLAVFCMMLIAYLVFYIFKAVVLEYLFTDYAGVEQLLLVFLLMIFPISLGGVIGQLGMLALGGEKEKRIFSKIYVWVGLLSIPVTVFFINIFDINGAVGTMLGVEFIVFLMFFIFIKREKLL